LTVRIYEYRDVLDIQLARCCQYTWRTTTH